MSPLLHRPALVHFKYVNWENKMDIHDCTDDRTRSIRFVNFWASFYDTVEWSEDYFAPSRLKRFFGPIVRSLPATHTLTVVTVFGPVPQRRGPNEIRIQYSGESYSHDASAYDCSLLQREDDPERGVISFPQGAVCLAFDQPLLVDCLNGGARGRMGRAFDASLAARFCYFCVSNGQCEERNQMFDILDALKPVDSIGPFKNNRPDIATPRHYCQSEYRDLLSTYRWGLCFENKRIPGYLTEKLIICYASGAVPIYWGDNEMVERTLNPKAVILVKDTSFLGMLEVARHVIQIDADPVLFRRMRSEPLFLDNELPHEWRASTIQDKMVDILRRRS